MKSPKELKIASNELSLVGLIRFLYWLPRDPQQNDHMAKYASQ